MNEVLQSAAKPQNFEESSQTIPEGSTLSNKLDFGSGCPLARNGEGDDIVESKRKNNFINKAILKFKDQFDYSNVEYINAKAKVRIVCKNHGEFTQTPDKHLQSVYACPMCNEESRSIRGKDKHLNNSSRTKSFDQFVKEANEKFNNKFKYSLDEV